MSPLIATIRPARSASRTARTGSPAAAGFPAASWSARPRAARRAGVRLGVEAAVGGILVFVSTGLAHREAAHRGRGAVVRDVEDDRVPRAAVRAVDERIPEPPVGGVQELAEAVGADGHVGRDQGHALAAAGRENAKAPGPLGRNGYGLDGRDLRERRRMVPQVAEEIVDLLGRTFHLDEDALGVVEDPPGQAALGGQAVDGRAEPDALDDAADADPPPHGRDGNARVLGSMSVHGLPPDRIHRKIIGRRKEKCMAQKDGAAARAAPNVT